MSKKSIFRQYSDLKRESEDLKARIEKLEKQLSRIEGEGTVRDLVYGGDGGIQPFHIEGIASADLSRVRTNLQLQKLRYEAAAREVERIVAEVDETIAAIPEADVRLMCRYYFVDGMTQQKVADKMFVDRSTVSKKLSKYGVAAEDE